MLELVICAVGTAAVLIAEHIGLWEHPWRLTPPVPYIVGTVTLGVGFTAWALWMNLLAVAVFWWFFAAIAGTPIIIAYWLRKVLSRRDEAVFGAGQLSRTPFKPYSQEAIDRGGRYAQDQGE